VKPSVLESKLREMEIKHGEEAFYELPDNHPDVQIVRRLAYGNEVPNKNRMDMWIERNGEELQKLSKTKNLDELSKHFKLSVDAIRSRLKKMGLKALPQPDRRRKKAKRLDWNEEETTFLIEHYQTMTASELARHFDISEKSIYIKASRLGLSKQKKLAMLDMNNKKVNVFNSIKEAAEKINVNAWSVRDACVTGKKYKNHYWEYI